MTRRFAPVAAFATASLILSYPLALHPLTTFPGLHSDLDVYAFLWNNWWIAHAVASLHRPEFTTAIWAPFEVDLRLHALGLLYGLMSAPLLPLLGTVGVVNLQVLATPVFNGLAAFVLAAQVTRNRQAALISGVLVAATPAINFHLRAGRPSCAALWPTLLVLYFWLRLLDRPTIAAGIWLGLSLVAAVLMDQQVVMYTLLWLVVLGAFAIAQRALTIATMRGVAVSATVAAVPLFWFCIAPLYTTRGYTIPAAFESEVYSYPISLLWHPSMLWGAYGLVLPLALVVGGLRWADQAIRPWLIGAASFVVLSFGPVVHRSGIPLPFAALRLVPGLAQFRTPYRFQMAAAIGMCMVAALLATTWLERRTHGQRRLAILALTLLILADAAALRLHDGFPVQTMPVESIYARIAADPDDCVVLEVPFGVRTGTDRIGFGERFTFYQPIHQKRLINGMVARGPIAALNYYRQSPAFMFLAHEAVPPGDIAADLRHQLSALKVGYVVVHRQFMDAEWAAQVVAMLDSQAGLRPIETGSAQTAAFVVERSRGPVGLLRLGTNQIAREAAAQIAVSSAAVTGLSGH